MRASNKKDSNNDNNLLPARGGTLGSRNNDGITNQRGNNFVRRNQRPSNRFPRTTVLFLLIIILLLTVGIFVIRSMTTISFTKSTSIRVFGPALSSHSIGRNSYTIAKNDIISFQYYTRIEQRNFLLSEHGQICQAAVRQSNKNSNYETEKMTTSTQNILVEKFDQLPLPYSIELWKFCVLYTGVGNVYWQSDNLIPIQLMENILGVEVIHLDANRDGDKKSRFRMKKGADTVNIVIQIDDTIMESTTLSNDEVDSDPTLRLHHSFLKLSKPKSKVALGMMRYLLDYGESGHNNAMVPLDTISLQQTLSMFVTNDINKKRNAWQLWTAICQDTTQSSTQQFQLFEGIRGRTTPLIDAPCAAEANEPCCQVWTASSVLQMKSPPSLLLHHSNVVNPEIFTDGRAMLSPLPFSIQDHDSSSIQENVSDDELGMPRSHLPFIATVREYRTNIPPATIDETPNYFDILLRNNCLPHDKDCFKCLKLGYKEGDDGGDCTLCQQQCPCYCNALCKVRPPPKRMAAEWIVTQPRYRKNPSRIIPRVIHQTWFEHVSKDKYPNMSRLIESFRKSGWEYEFYNDDKAAQLLSAHFPPAVREAYDALIPGAFKADLFRYCVLLIRGGIYADMDILLESNLDESVPADIGFLTAQDSPGEAIGHRSCLWNGLMAVAPGHPVLAQTIQTVVNNIRNRFTSVDYDDMLCPNPVLSVSHTVDTLFTCGPCILGASLNDILKRHRQSGFNYGEIDIFETEKNEVAAIGGSSGSYSSTSNYLSLVAPDDPRWLIPGKMVLLKQNKNDMGSHRFTAVDKNLIVAVTDMPEYDDRPKSIEHYSKSHVKFGIYGLTKLYTNQDRANEEILIRVDGNDRIDVGITSKIQ